MQCHPSLTKYVPSLIDLSGRIFGRLTVVSRDSADKHGKPKWRCLCECGAVISALGHSLKRGRVKSCGCLRRESARRNDTANKPHGVKYDRSVKDAPSDNCVPIVQPEPDLPPEPYADWTAAERRDFGMANPRAQWELQKRVSGGMSIAKAAAEIGLPFPTVQRYLHNNRSFRARLEKAQEWAADRAA